LTLASERPRAVLFDFYGTLAIGQPNERYERVLAGQEPTLGQAILADIENIVEFPLGLALNEPFLSAAAYRDWLLRQAVARLRDHHMPTAPDSVLADLANALLDCNTVVGLSVLPHARELLADLRVHGYQLGVCSNWAWDLADVLDDLGLSQYLDAIVASARVGASKPAPEIFEYALAALGRSADEVLFVGDNPVTDLAGAQRAGMPVVLVPNDGTGLPAVRRRLLPAAASGAEGRGTGVSG
jgi:HAD superfamily hydrolase (TIGR01509 family)